MQLNSYKIATKYKNDRHIFPHIEVDPAACELMELAPLYLANKGKYMVIAAPEQAKGILEKMCSVPEGKESTIIGTVSTKHQGRVVLTTVSGGARLIEPL